MELTHPSLHPFLTTVRITASGGPRGTQLGTGFFLDFAIDANRSSRWLITNRHVVEGAASITLRVHLGTRAANGAITMSADSGDLTIPNPAALMVSHPAEDLCGISGLEIVTAVEQQGRVMATESFRESMIPTQAQLEAMDTVTEVIMMGYPAGRLDETNNLPVLRRGVTASHPGLRFTGQCRGVIDATCYRGSSGSPILVWRDGHEHTDGRVAERKERWLIGVLVDFESDYVSVSVTVSDAPTNPWASGTIAKPLGLGKYIRAEALLDLKEAIRAGGRLL